MSRQRFWSLTIRSRTYAWMRICKNANFRKRCKLMVLFVASHIRKWKDSSTCLWSNFRKPRYQNWLCKSAIQCEILAPQNVLNVSKDQYSLMLTVQSPMITAIIASRIQAKIMRSQMRTRGSEKKEVNQHVIGAWSAHDEDLERGEADATSATSTTTEDEMTANRSLLHVRICCEYVTPYVCIALMAYVTGWWDRAQVKNLDVEFPKDFYSGTYSKLSHRSQTLHFLSNDQHTSPSDTRQNLTVCAIFGTECQSSWNTSVILTFLCILTFRGQYLRASFGEKWSAISRVNTIKCEQLQQKSNPLDHLQLSFAPRIVYSNEISTHAWN